MNVWDHHNHSIFININTSTYIHREQSSIKYYVIKLKKFITYKTMNVCWDMMSIGERRRSAVWLLGDYYTSVAYLSWIGSVWFWIGQIRLKNIRWIRVMHVFSLFASCPCPYSLLSLAQLKIQIYVYFTLFLQQNNHYYWHKY